MLCKTHYGNPIWKWGFADEVIFHYAYSAIQHYNNRTEIPFAHDRLQMGQKMDTYWAAVTEDLCISHYGDSHLQMEQNLFTVAEYSGHSYHALENISRN